MPLPVPAVCPPPTPTPAPDPSASSAFDGCAPALLATDDFERPDGPINTTITTTGGLIWNDPANTLDIDSGHVVAGAGALTDTATVQTSPMGWIEATLTIGGAGGLAVLVMNRTIGVGLGFGEGVAFGVNPFVSAVNYALDTLDTGIPIATGDRLGLRSLNGTATAYVNGLAVATAPISAAAQQLDTHGLWLSGLPADVQFDDFEVGSFPCGEPAEILFTIEARHQNINGAGGAFTPDPNTQSISIRTRVVGAPGSVVIATASGNLLPLAGEIYSWAVIRDQDTEVLGVGVVTTDVADDVIVWYTVAVPVV